MANRKPQDSEGITWISSQSLIRLRHQANKLNLKSGKIHASQGGAYLSSFKGRGMEFDESRIYLPGDDIRNMDWRVTARTGKAHTKIFQEERERPVLLWLDLNPSMFFATRGAFKSVIATKIAALLAWSTASQNDRLGALIFSGDKHMEMRPARGKTAVLDFIGRACKHVAWDNTKPVITKNISLAMSRLRKVTRPGSLIFLISDFRDDNGKELDDRAQSHLINIARNNDVVLIHVFDPIETTLPPSGQYKVSNGEQEMQLNTSSKQMRAEYHDRFEHHQKTLQTLCRQHRMHLISASTQDDALESLQQGLGVRSSQNTQFRSAK